MKFDELRPGANYLDQFCDGMCKGRVERLCWHCGQSTTWYDIDFMAPLCSEECRKAKWEEYAHVTLDTLHAPM